MYIYIERERERERKKKKERKERERERENENEPGEKRACEDSRGDPCARAPPPRKVHWRNSALGSLRPKQKHYNKRTTLLVEEGTNPLRWRSSCASHSSQGRARSPVPEAARFRSGHSSENVRSRKKPKTGKTQTTQKTTKTPLPLSVRENGLKRGEEARKLKPHDVPRESPKLAWPKTAPRENARREGMHSQNGW